MAMAASKRKRDSQDIPDMRAGPGFESSEFEQQYMPQDDNGDLDFVSVLAQSQHADASDSAIQDDSHAHQQPPQQQQQIQPHPQHHIQPSHNQRRSQSHGHGAGQSATDTATAALAQFHTMTVPQPTENTFMSQPTDGGDRVSATPAEGTNQRTGSFGEADAANGSSSSPTGNAQLMSGKPTVGSEEWHKVRRDNHKEGKYLSRSNTQSSAMTNKPTVERRRRETINEGINELAKIVPGCEKNKGSILARGVQFITQLKENETQNIEKWTLEKLLTEQAIAELSSSVDKLKAECQRAWTERDQWKKAAQKAGVSIDADAKGTPSEGDNAA